MSIVEQNKTEEKIMQRRTYRREYMRKWRTKNPEKALNASRKWALVNPEKIRGYQLKNDFGITIEQYNEMLEAQGRRCAICGTDTPNGRGGFHVDHNHKTNTIRGILCHNCNVLLGHAKDDIKIIELALNYLKREG